MLKSMTLVLCEFVIILPLPLPLPPPFPIPFAVEWSIGRGIYRQMVGSIEGIRDIQSGFFGAGEV